MIRYLFTSVLTLCLSGISRAQTNTADELHRLLYAEVLEPYLKFYKQVEAGAIPAGEKAVFSNLFVQRPALVNDYNMEPAAVKDFVSATDYVNDITMLFVTSTPRFYSDLKVDIPSGYRDVLFCHDGSGIYVWLQKTFTFKKHAKDVPPVSKWVKLYIKKAGMAYKIAAVTISEKPMDYDYDGIADRTQDDVACDQCIAGNGTERYSVKTDGCTDRVQVQVQVKYRDVYYEEPVKFRRGFIVSVTGGSTLPLRESPPFYDHQTQQWQVHENGGKGGRQLGIAFEYNFEPWFGLGAGGLELNNNLDVAGIKSGMAVFLSRETTIFHSADIRSNAHRYYAAYAFASFGYRNKWYGIRLEPTVAQAYNNPFSDNSTQVHILFTNNTNEQYQLDFKTGPFMLYGAALRLEAWFVQNRLGIALGGRYLSGTPKYQTQTVAIRGLLPRLQFPNQQIRFAALFAGIQVRMGARE